MIEKFFVIPYGCKSQFNLTGEVNIMLLTTSPSMFNEYRSIPDSLIETVGEITGLDERDDLSYTVDLSLVTRGRVVKSTKQNHDIVNNKLLAIYKHDFTIFELMEKYELDGFLVTKPAKIDFNKLLVTMVDRYIDLFSKYSTYSDKQKLKSLPTFREKLYTLTGIMSESMLRKIHFVEVDKEVIYQSMVYDFAILDSVMNNKSLYSSWSIVKHNYKLAPYVLGDTVNDILPLCDYMFGILNKSLSNLVEYNVNGTTNPSIISVDGNKYFDIENDVILKAKDIGKVNDE